jgi:hypothetical protein
MPGAPRGRSAGTDKEAIVACKKCGEKIRGFEDLKPEDRCPRCGSDLHSCVQCVHFDTSSRWECRKSEKIPARISAKTARNVCVVFSPALSFDLTGTKAPDSPTDARAAFERLFKKPGA